MNERAPLKINLDELVSAGILDELKKLEIETYYQKHSKDPQNKLLVAFSMLGAMLTGLGIILIIAHNWDNFGRAAKTFFAFLPLLVSQSLAVWVFLKRKESIAWREGVSVFLFFSVGACVALVSQIYHIAGDPGQFALVWILLTLPVIYILRSSALSLLEISAITWYAMETGYGVYSAMNAQWYWLLLAAVIPHYRLLETREKESLFTFFHGWFLPLSLIISIMAMVGQPNGTALLLVFVFMLSAFRGVSGLLSRGRKISNGFYALGTVGIFLILIMLSFDFWWSEVLRDFENTEGFVYTGEIIFGLIFLATALFLLYKTRKTLPGKGEQITDYSFLILLLLYPSVLADYMLPVIMVNILVIVAGIGVVRRGLEEDNLGTLNFGLLVIASLIISRFFDFELSFFTRGVMFIITGAAFFGANYSMIKKRRGSET
ncbi:MAG: hypothetical protein AMXMBFR48_30060 [Ignavibacteriales bacterium]